MQHLIYTAILFTWTDYKTILIPVTAFACATGPIHSVSKLLQSIAWIWIHLLLCNVSNQAGSEAEDKINHPWRPLPSGMITKSQARQLRMGTVITCLLWSWFYGLDLVAITAALIATTWMYDEAGLSNTALGKNFCNIGGYVSLELGATKLMGKTLQLDTVSITAALLSGALIFTTIQAQDFPDVEGDAASGRITFPIYAPEFSRVFTLFATVMWSIGLGWYWASGTVVWEAFTILGLYVGFRYYKWRTPDRDRRSYLIFNVWLVCAHLLPLHARLNVPPA
ncbi:UbiA prenyltransferase family [Mycena belliarum]|uniref:UbiA prenyltransferase family n=1 Tax=Mycena belliarum TaxID=1033014 RepID=A0AAD6TYS2_9AGAR|nr:UbiA prenyltransferase family [Mycena belliae]